MEQKTVLIVEDDAILAVQLRNMLVDMGYNVLEPVASGEAAIAAMAAERSEPGLPDLILPDLILMDIQLSGPMDGITAAEHIRKVADVPVVFLTGYSHDPLLQRAKTTMPYGYLVKPVSSRELVATIEMALYKHTIDRQLRESEDRHKYLYRIEVEKAELEAQNRQLQKEESLGRMAGAIAHHFNNQLHVVMGNMEVAMNGMPQDSDTLEILTEAMQAARKASEVSSLMLTYLGQTTGKRESLYLAEVCQQSLPMLCTILPEDLTLKADMSSPGPAIRANENHIRQVLTNLVCNAREASDAGGMAIHINVKPVSAAEIPASPRFPIDWLPQDTTYACLEVSDTGCGISDQDIKKIFDPFFSSKFTGRGLGLSVVLGIVRAYGGVVTVESEPGRGSIFRIFLPVSTDAVLSQPLPFATTETSYMDKSDKTPMTGSSGALLLVEDEKPVRKMARVMLTRLGVAVLEAEDGVEAVEVFRQHQNKIICVLCDLTMPQMDGWETLAALRKISPGKWLRQGSGYVRRTCRMAPGLSWQAL
jgi:signal transduction histidine kinase